MAATLWLLGKNIRNRRKSLGLSLTTLARLSGVTKGALSKIENGGNPSAASLYCICWALGVPPSFVLPNFVTSETFKLKRKIVYVMAYPK